MIINSVLVAVLSSGGFVGDNYNTGFPDHDLYSTVDVGFQKVEFVFKNTTKSEITLTSQERMSEKVSCPLGEVLIAPGETKSLMVSLVIREDSSQRRRIQFFCGAEEFSPYMSSVLIDPTNRRRNGKFTFELFESFFTEYVNEDDYENRSIIKYSIIEVKKVRN